MTAGQENEHGPHWWKVRALTTAPETCYHNNDNFNGVKTIMRIIIVFTLS